MVMPSATKHGGAEVALLQLLKARNETGLDLQVCFLEAGEMVGIAESVGVRTFILRARQLRNLVSFFGCVRSLRKIILAETPDAVLAWMTKGHIYSGLAAIGTSTKSIYFQMGLPDDGIVDRLCRLIPAAGALGCSEFVAREQRARVKYPVVDVPLAADVPHPEAAMPIEEQKRRLGFDPNRPLVGIVGRLQRWKGMHVYLHAMSNIVKRHSDVQGVIVGGKHDLEPDYPAFLESIWRTEGLHQVVRMVGRQTNVPEWMRAMDIVVHASEREPFGIVVVEAMALQKAVIATMPGGPEEIITNGENGLLVPYGDVTALATAIESLLQNQSLAGNLASAAKERSTQFTVPQFARNVSAAIARIAAAASSDRLGEPQFPS